MKRSGMQDIFAGILVGLGMILMAYGVLSAGAPEGAKTLNLGLLVDKINITLVGCAVFVSGVMCWLDAQRKR